MTGELGESVRKTAFCEMVGSRKSMGKSSAILHSSQGKECQQPLRKWLGTSQGKGSEKFKAFSLPGF